MKKFFKISGELLIYVGIYMVIQILLTFILSIIYGIRAAIERQVIAVNLQTILNQSTLYILIGSVMLSFIIYFLLFRAKKEDLIARCNFSSIKISNIGLAVLLGITFNFTLSILNIVASFYKLFPDHEKLMEQLIGGDFVPTLIIVGIAVPIFEEILFRGIIFNELRKHLPLAAAILTQGLIFGIYHLNFFQGIYGILLGIFAALVYIWFNSIWAPISLHVAFNTLSVIMNTIVDERFMSEYGAEMLISSGLILGVTIYLLWKNRIRTIDITGSGMCQH